MGAADVTGVQAFTEDGLSPVFFAFSFMEISDVAKRWFGTAFLIDEPTDFALEIPRFYFCLFSV